MTCRHTTELYTEWREGTISRWDRIKLAIHLSYCPGCPHYVKQMDETVRLLHDLEPPRVEPPANLFEALEKARRR